MRPFYYLPLVAAIAACESGAEVAPAVVQWMQWPAEVQVGKAFDVRLIVPYASCRRGAFRPGVAVDQSAVTFAPYFILSGPEICPPEPLDFTVPYFALDTTGTAPGLDASSSRTFEMRAAAFVFVPTPEPYNGGQPVRTFGDVTVRLSNPDASRTNGAGYVSLFRDYAGCARIAPNGYYNPDVAVVLEDQADTTGLSYAFVRGYIYEVAAPVCGQTRVFHVVSRN